MSKMRMKRNRKVSDILARIIGCCTELYEVAVLGGANHCSSII